MYELLWAAIWAENTYIREKRKRADNTEKNTDNDYNQNTHCLNNGQMYIPYYNNACTTDVCILTLKKWFQREICADEIFYLNISKCLFHQLCAKTKCSPNNKLQTIWHSGEQLVLCCFTEYMWLCMFGFLSRQININAHRISQKAKRNVHVQCTVYSRIIDVISALLYALIAFNWMLVCWCSKEQTSNIFEIELITCFYKNYFKLVTFFRFFVNFERKKSSFLAAG